MKTINISGFRCDCVAYPGSSTVTYLLYPALEPFSEEWVTKISKTHAVSVCVVYVPADKWNDVLTPWPEPGEAKGFEPFAGEAPKFFDLLVKEIVPECETSLEIPTIKSRDLIGVSLSGLFTLWQWLQHDTFRNIGSLSGSFWYDGFMEWFQKQPIPEKKGEAYFLLGVEEPKAHIKAYRSVGENTEAIVERLKQNNIRVSFDWVPGNHFSDPVHRATMAFDALYGGM